MTHVEKMIDKSKIQATPVILLSIKPVSTNNLYGITKRGRKYKKQEATDFENAVDWMLRINAFAVEIPQTRDLELITRVYVSRKFDTSNCLKLLEDCIAKFFKFNDRRFAGHRTSRVVVKEGQERIKFKILEYQDDLFRI